MKYFVVLDNSDNTKYAIIGANGFIPKGIICEAPRDADREYIKDASIIRVDDIQPTMELPRQLVDENGELIFETLERQTYDLEDNLILDDNDNPVMEDYESSVYELDGNGDPIMDMVPYGDTYKQASIDSTLKAIKDAKMASIRAIENANKYREDRKEEYPSVGDQLDAIYKKLHLGDSIEYDAIALQIEAIKIKYPKSE